MIKRQFNIPPVVNVGGRGCIITAHRLLRRRLHQERHGDIMPARVTVRCRIDADEPTCAGTYSCFFFQFALHGGLDGFAIVHKSAGEGVLALIGWVFPPDEKKASLLVEENGVDR
jgi:hypothetical protein